ncbi:MAG: DUF262 domain-containing protein [Thioploca sp.]|nr:DUF262 domain-containing protein [Thioploca sp.]
MITPNQTENAEKQIYSQQQEVAYDTREFTVELLVSKYLHGIENDENEIYVPEYQREFVWDKERQSKFIESIVLGLPIPFIFVAEMTDGRLEIVDGSQRIRTLAAFLENKLQLEKIEVLTYLNGFYFHDLSIPRQRKFRNAVIRMVVLSDKATEKVRTEMFKRINRGSDILNNMEVRKGLMRGKFRDFIYHKCATIELLNQLCPLPPLAQKRQELPELILRFFAFIDKYPNYSKGLGNFLDAYLDEKNQNFSEIEEKEKLVLFDNVLQFVHKHFPKGFVKPTGRQQYASKMYFESVSVGVALALQEQPELLQQAPINLKWLNSQNFRKVVEPRFDTHSPKCIKVRIDFVKNALLGSEIDINEVINAENED